MQLNAIVFASGAAVQAGMQKRCTDLGDVKVLPAPDVRPSIPEIIHLINAGVAELLFIEFQDREDALRTEAEIHSACPNVAILGFADNWPSDALIKTPRGYLRIIPASLELENLRATVLGAITAAKIPGPDNVIVFLPAKAGGGASTIALNVTGALANKCVKSTILIESDLYSGPAAMYLNLKPAYSVLDALNRSERLDVSWNDLITPVGNFTILTAPPAYSDALRPSFWAYRRLLAFIRQRYEYAIFDLPEVVNPATHAIVAIAKMIYVVCTPEVASLVLARRRCALLIERGIPEDRFQIVLNRFTKDGADPSAISEIVGYPIAQVIPDDPKSLADANLRRRLVDEKTPAGQALEGFAWNLTGQASRSKPARKLFSSLFPAA